MSQGKRIVSVMAGAALMLGAAAAQAQGRIKVGEELSYRVASPAAYPVGGPDRPVTGGYAKIATVLEADFSRVARAVPGAVLRFREAE